MLWGEGEGVVKKIDQVELESQDVVFFFLLSVLFVMGCCWGR